MGKYRSLLVFALLFMPVMCQGQYVSNNIQFTGTNNDAGCAVASCWNQLGTHGGSVNVQRLAFAPDGTLFALDASQNTYKYDPSTDAFSLFVGASNGVWQITAQDSQTLYGIGNNNGSTHIYKSVNGGAWTAVSFGAAWGSLLAVGGDGTLFQTGSDGVSIWQYTAQGGWVRIAWVIPTITALSAADAMTVGYADSNNNVWSYNGSPGSWASLGQSAHSISSMTWDGTTAFLLRSDGFARHQPGGTWYVFPDPSGSPTSFAGGSDNMYEFMAAGGNLYQWNSLKLSAQNTASGNYQQWCHLNPQPCVNATHTLTKHFYFGNQVGSTAHASGTPFDQLSVNGQDTTVACDPFLDASPSCTVTDAPVANCSNMGPLQVAPALPCILSPLPARFDWPSGKTIHVYFDSARWSGDCPGADWCFFYQGISTWNTVNVNFTTYENDGLASDADQMACVTSHNICAFNWPWLFVTTTSALHSCDKLQASCAREILTAPLGTYSYINISSSIPTGDRNQEIGTGAIEEAHHNGLADCKGLCTGTNATTVTMPQYDPSKPLFPTWCDIIWSDLYLTVLRPAH